MKSRSFLGYLTVTLKGMAMGAADVVPGVSGGTIALISGIYEELLETINSVNFSVIKTLRKEGIKAAWNQINGNFLLALILGIGISIASLAKVFKYLLHEYPILVWALFFGLVVASVFLVGKTVKKWNAGSVAGLVIGTAIAFGITILPQGDNSGELWFIFLSGMLAICAMILPGISGSFILVLLGSYGAILTGVSEVNLVLIATFGAGAVIGLLTFSRVLKWLFNKFHDITIAMMTGFLIGSLNKLWPWKETTKWRLTSSGELESLMEKNVLPGAEYREVLPANPDLILITKNSESAVNLGGQGEGWELIGDLYVHAADPQTLYAALAAVGGFAIIFFMERLAGSSIK